MTEGVSNTAFRKTPAIPEFNVGKNVVLQDPSTGSNPQDK
jgi:hypothetical protein